MFFTPKILIVDDEPRMCDSLKILLREHCSHIETAHDGRHAMRCLNDISFDLVLLDIVLPDIDGYEIMDFINRECSDTLVIVLTGSASTESAVKALRGGACDFFNKPFEPDELVATIGNILDQKKSMRDRKMAEKTLVETNNFLKNILDSSSSISIISTDLEQNVLFWNKGAENIFGYKAEEIIGRQKISLLYPGEEELNQVKAIRSKMMKEKKGVCCEVREITKDGRKIWINMNLTPRLDEEGHVIGILGIGEDISRRKLAEQALKESEKKIEDAFLKAEKLDSLGTFAGGVAHDFNNLLSVIVGNLSLMEDDIDPFSDTSKFLKEAEKASLRARDLTSRLITFSRGDQPVKKVSCIEKLITDSAATTLSGSDVDCRFSIPDALFPVSVDREQIKQVIHKILINASEAMAGDGTIHVCCENVMIGGKDTLPLKDSQYVKISIRDQGVGIPEKYLIKIFDPYFSTKEIGSKKGTGLGLAVCNSIVEKHNGFITAESEPGVETTFFIYLPASDEKIPVLHPGPAIKAPVTGSVKILFMDDEKMIRNFAVRVLRRIGYVTQVTRNGAEAIELYKKAKGSGEPFDAVILDLTNQFGMGGKEAIKKLIEIDPEVKGIVSTGYSNDPIVNDFRKFGFRGVLTKPYSVKKLDKTLHEILQKNNN
jgi:two-component system, cell cycle sensor histidine kinase and response regulator CckA